MSTGRITRLPSWGSSSVETVHHRLSRTMFHSSKKKIVPRPANRMRIAASAASTANTTVGAREDRANSTSRSARPPAGAARAAGSASATCDTLAGIALLGRTELAQAGPEPRTSHGRPVRSAVVATAEVVLEEDVQDDEQVAAAHLGQAQLGLAVGPIGPRDRQDRGGKAANDGLWGQPGGPGGGGGE